MSRALKDGAWITATEVVRYDCDKCGSGFHVTRWPQNEREIDEFIRKHAHEKHGGFAPRY